MARRRDNTLSRYLSLVLRRAPEKAGVTLDSQGWVLVEELLAGAAAHGRVFSRAELDEVVATNDKKRFELDPAGTRIRAAQGHSVAVSLGHKSTVPPDVLFHGTHPRALDAIRRQGLRPMARRHVHLSRDEQTASTVGARRGRPVVLRVDAARMSTDGLEFFQATNGVWLCDHVAPTYLTFPPQKAV